MLFGACLTDIFDQFQDFSVQNCRIYVCSVHVLVSILLWCHLWLVT